MKQKNTTLVIDNNPISLNVAINVIFGQSIEISSELNYLKNLNDSVDCLSTLLDSGKIIYGVNTGYGDSCTTYIPEELQQELPKNLYTYHLCGLGNHFNEESTRAILLTRLISLSKGYSAVRPIILTHLTYFLNHNILPIIPEIGSVGASGDLTPLAYIAATLSGEQMVSYKNNTAPSKEVLHKEGLPPIQLKIKETLAIMNGTAVMTGLAILATHKAKQLCQLSTQITTLTAIALNSHAEHFHPHLFQLKPFPGQQLIADEIYSLLKHIPSYLNKQLQDRYSIRCAPHIIGVLMDALSWMIPQVEIELNSVTDNPVFFSEETECRHGGHFYGGHMAFITDSLKTLLANIGDLLDRQLAQLVDTKFNQGLPSNLSGASKESNSIHHGLKAVQILVSALTAEMANLSLPVSLFSRSTECHNQDKVSMGTISARRCLEVIDLLEMLSAACLFSSTQAVSLRLNTYPILKEKLPSKTLKWITEFHQDYPLLQEDRALDTTLTTLKKELYSKIW